MFLLLVIACAHPGAVEAPLAAAAAPAEVVVAADLDDAVAVAETVGDLTEALELAREAYVASPDRRRHRVVQRLEAQVADAGGVAALP